MPDEYADYQGKSILAAPQPRAERVGRWWRRRWHFTLTGSRPEGFVFPPPMGEMEDVAFVIASRWTSESELVIETFTLHERYSGSELTYLSLVAVWLRECAEDGDLMIEGVVGHPLLRLCRLSEAVIAEIKSYA
jgi:hypothetical protein